MSKTTKRIEESGQVMNLLLIIGFLGIIWLMIYGNLSGNLGFSQDSSSFTNQTIELNDTGDIPAGALNRINPSLTSIVMTNATGGEVISSGNYTVTGVTFTNITAEYGEDNVNVSYVVRYDSNISIGTENVISNLTGGIGTFFGFSNTFFLVTAIVLLIVILLGALAVVLTIVKMRKGKSGKGFVSN